jgi:hypothetical protein
VMKATRVVVEEVLEGGSRRGKGNEEMPVDEFGVVICEEQKKVLPTAPCFC